jgi:endoglucanase
LLFLPAAQGFTDATGATLNLSYYMPLAMREVARATDTPVIATCAADGASIMQSLSREGPMPDWISIGPNGFFLPARQSDRNGYEAMRVALFLIWSGNPNHPAVTAQMVAYNSAQTRNRDILAGGENVTVFDRKSRGVIETSKHVGYGALPTLINCMQASLIGSSIPSYQTVGQAYYPATLHLMVLIAQITNSPECVPI